MELEDKAQVVASVKGAKIVQFLNAPAVLFGSVRKQRSNSVQGRFEPPVTVIMLSPGVTGTARHLGFASVSSLRSSRFLLDPNILSGQSIPSGESSGSVQPLAQFVPTASKSAYFSKYFLPPFLVIQQTFRPPYNSTLQPPSPSN